MPSALGAGMSTSSWIRRDIAAPTRISRVLLIIFMLLSPRLVAGAQGYQAMQPMATRAE